MALNRTIINALTGVNLYALTVPSGAAFPAATYQQISDRPIRTHAGNAARRVRYQINCFGEDYESSNTLATTVKGLLDLNTTNFLVATKENEIQTKEAESGLYSTLIEFFILTNEFS